MDILSSSPFSRRNRNFNESRSRSLPKINRKLLNTDLYRSTEVLIKRTRKCTCRYLWNYELHGLTSYLKSKTLTERIAWSIIIFTCVFFAIWTTKMVFAEYLERQTATLITIKSKPRALLPTILLCPKNPDSLNYPSVLKHIKKRLPRLDRITMGNLISFAIAGAGFHNMEPILAKISNSSLERIAALFRRWRGSQTLDEFFQDLFEAKGYKCQDFFRSCFYGYQQIPCCDLFYPYYMMLRGRCFRMDQRYQTDPDVFGRIGLSINQLPSRLIDFVGGMQPQVVLYISDKFRDVSSTFPRYYVNFHDMLYFRIRSKRIVMTPWNSQCQTNKEIRGKGACFVNKWLWKRIINPLNCTLFYMKYKTPHLETCPPEIIVKNYKMVNDVKMGTDKNRCLPDCSRRDYSMSVFKSETSIPRNDRKIPDFRLEISYVFLEEDRYEEVVTTTLPGFVSQLGGQSGLFVGLSVCTLIQIAISTIRYLYLKFNRYFKIYVKPIYID